MRKIKPPGPQPAEIVDQPAPARRSSIALALGGGGARGLAHVVVLETLEELGLRPTVIAGTSIGAIYGAAYASGLPAAAIRAMTEETLAKRFELLRQLYAARSSPVQKVLRLLPVRRALLNPEAVLDGLLPSRLAPDFESLAIPLKLVATDLGSHSAAILTSGPLRSAIAASMAIPVVFQPVIRDGRPLVDGGLVNPLPFELITHEADITIAIDVSGAASETVIGPAPSVVEMLAQSLQMLEKSITREKLKRIRPDIYIDVDLDRFNALAFHKPREILAASAPVKELLKRQLDRILTSETVEPSRHLR